MRKLMILACLSASPLCAATISMEGELIGSISMSGNAFVGGAYDDPRLDVDYFAGEDGKNAFFAPSLNFWVEPDDEALSPLPNSTLRSVGHIQFLPLIESTRTDCRSEPRDCWLDGKMLGLPPDHEVVQETARVCDDCGGVKELGIFASREVPR